MDDAQTEKNACSGRTILAAVTLLAARIGIPYPILMVVAGLAIGLVPAVPTVELHPEIVLALFLPPILFSGAYFLSARDLWHNIRPITLLAAPGIDVAAPVELAARLVRRSPKPAPT